SRYILILPSTSQGDCCAQHKSAIQAIFPDWNSVIADFSRPGLDLSAIDLLIALLQKHKV
ncbi:MAG: hypothetical protein ABW007_24300, partial [Chitinophagaceae bacterium]